MGAGVLACMGPLEGLSHYCKWVSAGKQYLHSVLSESCVPNNYKNFLQ